MFTLQILHASDLEGGVDAIASAPNFAVVVDALEADAAAKGYGSILLSAGDNYIPGPFFNAAQFVGDDVFTNAYNSFFADELGDEMLSRVGDGRGFADIAIMNFIGFDASAVGNHEFDSGTDTFEGIIEEALDDNTTEGVFGESLADIEHFGALFPYLSTNLDFSQNADLGNLFTDEILPSTDYFTTPASLLDGSANSAKIANATTIDVDGELVGVVGATTQIVETISSTGTVTDTTGGANDMAALAASLQPVVDALIADGVNKIVIVSHLQQFALEQELATLMTGVDVIIAGGSDTIVADADDRLRDGDTVDVEGYPFVATGADGNPVAVVSSAGEYSYVGRLVVEFDDDGVIIPESIEDAESGAFATDDEGVLAAVALTEDGSITVDGIELAEANEVPPVTDGPATGTASATLLGDTLTVSGTFSDLSSDLLDVSDDVDPEGNPIDSAHIHVGAPDENGPVVRGLTVTDNGDGSGSFEGTFTLTADELAEAEAGNLYINVHTADNGSGELRAQIPALVPTPGPAPSVEGAIAASESATLVQGITDAVQTQVTESDGTIAGETEVFLEGRREAVRTEETNFGNLTADANIAAARAVDPTVTVSLKNGGGIRAPIGEIDGTTGELLPTQANPLSGKEEGQVSELDIQNALRFDNGLTLVTLSSEDLKIVLEHAVAGSGEGATPGQFFQVGGIRVAVDLSGTAQELDDDGNVTTAGTRIQTVALIDDEGSTTEVIVEDGAVVDGAPTAIRVVTLDFLVGDEGDLTGGDGYPYRALGEDIVDTGIGEQQALTEFLTANNPEGGDTDFDIAETAPALDSRIQLLDARSDTAGAPAARDELTVTIAEVFQGESDPDDEDSPEGASEVVAFDAGRLFTTNGNLGRIDVFADDDAAPAFLDLSFVEGFDGVQSVAAEAGIVVAVADVEPTDGMPNNGVAAIFGGATLELITTVETGNLPDSVAISPDGTTIAIANEGEFNSESDLTTDAPGTVTLIDISDIDNPVASTVGFDGIDPGLVRTLPGVDPALDVEPEYVTFSPDGSTLFVSLQENNAIAVIDVATQSRTAVIDAGTVDHSVEGFGIDSTDDDVIDIETRDVLGLRMPDSIAAAEIGGTLYLLGANEGDGRGDGFDDGGNVVPNGDEARVGDLVELGVLDDSIDPAGLERLIVSTIDGDTDGDGDIDQLHSFGSRSFTIWDTDGSVVFDSGDEMESIIANLAPERFNDDDGELGQNRSDAKGPEPEALAVGQIGAQTYAFIGAERDSGVFVYNITEVADSRFVTYLDGFESGNIGPETIVFIDPSESTTGSAQIAVAYEISGSTVVYDLARLGSDIVTEDFYQVALGRSTDTGGYDFWSGVFEVADINLLAQAFEVSNEFQASIEGLSDEDAIDLVYNNALGRDATDEETTAAQAIVDEQGFSGLFLEFVDEQTTLV